MKKVIGLYAGHLMTSDNPKHHLGVLKDRMGLNLILIGGDVRLSPEIQRNNPLPVGEERRGPGMNWAEDDTALRRTIDAAHALDIRVWLMGGGWHGSAREFPELCMQGMDGRPISEVPPLKYAMEQGALAFCPNNREINTWMKAAFADVMRRYEVEGMDITHARYTAPSFFHNLFGCACPTCAEVAGEMGYDFDRMKAGVLKALDRIRDLEVETLRSAGDLGLDFIGFTASLAEDTAVFDWFNYRTDVLSRHLKAFKDAVHEAADREVVFACDTFPPSFAILVGHRYRDLMESCDFTSPLLPHVDFFILSTFAAYAELLRNWTKGLSEEEAVRTVYRFFGYEHLPMPGTIEGIGVGIHSNCETGPEIPLYDIVNLEMRRARGYNTGEVPSYPVIKGWLWPTETVRELVRAAEEMGHEGIIFQGTSSLLGPSGER